MNQQGRSCSISGEETKYFDRIPVDLLISNILSRLPLKSIAQCRCVSKLWSSIIRRPNNNLLFPIKSPAQPRILFTIGVVGGTFFYSNPQPHNPDENTSSVAHLHHRAPGSIYDIYGPPVGGLICCQHYRKKHSTSAMILNPSTGEFLVLPKLRMGEINSERSNVNETYSFGYDPIDKQFKVLRIISLCNTKEFGQYRVLTLGTGNKNLSWRKTQSCTVHYRLGDTRAICISGVLYYPAGIYIDKPNFYIACFDVRSENFSFTNIDEDMTGKKIVSFGFSLIDYKGKLGACYCDTFHNLFELWVLEDAQRHEWSKHIYQMPHSWLPEMISVHAVGMIGGGEIVLCSTHAIYHFFTMYYNLESNIITRVELEVPLFKKNNGHRVQAFANYVEDLKLM